MDSAEDPKIPELIEEVTSRAFENSETLNQQIADQSNFISGLKTAVADLEEQLENHKILIRFRDAKISALEEANPDEATEIRNLREEIRILRNSLKSDVQANLMQAENKRLSEELEKLKSSSLINPLQNSQQVLDLKEMNYKLTQAVNLLVQENQKTNEKLVQTAEKKNT